MAELDDPKSHATVELSPDAGEPPVVVICGEVDMSNVVTVEAELDRAMATRPNHVVFDVSELTFIDSSGIAVLLRAAEKTERLELRNPPTIVQRIIQATGLTEILRVES